VRGVLWLAALAFGLLRAEDACVSGAPCYTEASIVSSASNRTEDLAPNTLVTIYGRDLAYSTRALNSEDVAAGMLPTLLAGVVVHVGAATAPLYYVSPGQINLLIPGNLLAGAVEVKVVRDGRAGPTVRLRLQESAPALFARDPDGVAATHADGTLISRDKPARAGEVIVLYGTGLGLTTRGADSQYREIPKQAAQIARLQDLRVTLAGVVLEPARVLYAGISPGFAGLYQINLALPDQFPADPEVQVRIGEQLSAPGVKLSAQPSAVTP
jgi:uncharacterized protein (TIGR03437 family)